jgi:hypothetical protein
MGFAQIIPAGFLRRLRDVTLTSLADGDVISWDAAEGKFVNAEPAAGGAASILAPYLGDGSDGAVVLDGVNTFAWALLVGSTYTITRSVFATTIVVDNAITLDTANWLVSATVSITNNGTIQNFGTAIAASGFTQGSWPAGTKALTRQPGGNGGATTTGSNGASNSGNRGGNAGAGGVVGATNGGTGGTATWMYFSNIDQPSPWNFPKFAAWANVSPFSGGGFSGGGGGGGGASVDASHRGGGGGYGGGCLVLNAPAIANNGAINAPGGNGATSPSSTNGGGGGGGGGGWIITNSESAVTGAGTYNVAGGTHGDGVGTGANGADGSAGTVQHNVWS